jgi:mannose-6-phosphate isomerase-like protein (cupin superfamily)
MNDKAIETIVTAWKTYFATADWREMVRGVTPVPNGCGQLYEIDNPIDRPQESVAIADMRKLAVGEPHYHPAPCVEVYIALEGSGNVVIGGKEHRFDAGAALVVPPDTAHFTIPYGLVIAVINTPPFKPENYVPLTGSDPRVHFDKTQFENLSDE